MKQPFRDCREPRDWRLWKEPAGIIDCCSGCTGAFGYTAGHFSFVTSLGSGTNIEKTCIPTTLTSVIAAVLSASRGGSGGITNPSVAGYILGGVEASKVTFATTTDKLDYASDTITTPGTAVLSQARAFPDQGVSERSTKGYLIGGQLGTGGASNSVVTCDKLTYAGDSTAATATGNLSVARRTMSTVTDGSTKGYMAGGRLTGGATSAVTDKITYSTDTTAATATANLTATTADTAGGSDGSTKGYFTGFRSGGNLGNKITFSTDTTSSVAGVALNRDFCSSFSDGNVMIVAAGDDGSGVAITTINSIDFPTDTASLGSGTMTNLHQYPGSVSTVGL